MLINLNIFTVLMVKSRSGKDLLMLNGYTYYQHKQLRDGYRWSCTQMGSRSCRGYLHVTREKFVVRAYIVHTHPPSTYFLEKIRQNFAMSYEVSLKTQYYYRMELTSETNFVLQNLWPIIRPQLIIPSLICSWMMKREQ